MPASQPTAAKFTIHLWITLPIEDGEVSMTTIEMEKALLRCLRKTDFADADCEVMSREDVAE